MTGADQSGRKACHKQRGRMIEARERRERCRATLASLTAASRPILLHPATVARYLADVQTLADMLHAGRVSGQEQIAQALRALLHTIVVHPDKNEPRLAVTGHLAKLTGAAVFPQQTVEPLQAVAGAGQPDALRKVVAGAGLEPATSGL